MSPMAQGLREGWGDSVVVGDPSYLIQEDVAVSDGGYSIEEGVEVVGITGGIYAVLVVAV
jgi:DNA gyrase inhibitor GyrI